MYVHIDRKEPYAKAHDLVIRMSNIMYVFALASIKNDAL